MWSKQQRDEYQQRKRVERRNYCIEKLGGKCVVCGSTDDLQFDHIMPIGPIVGRRISELLTASIQRLDKELELCQLLCVPCHRYKSTHIDVEHASLRHGTVSALRYCRPICNLCREIRKVINREAMRQYRAERIRIGDMYIKV